MELQMRLECQIKLILRDHKLMVTDCINQLILRNYRIRTVMTCLRRTIQWPEM